MQNIPLLFIFILLTASCDHNTNPEFKDFQFLLGDWERINNQEGFRTYESWKLDEAKNFLGFGFTMQGEDTVFKEYMQILWLDSAFYLKVEGVNEQATFFYVDKKRINEFSCVNEENEFPKNIAYSLQNEVLTAVISDDSNEIKFTFRGQ